MHQATRLDSSKRSADWPAEHKEITERIRREIRRDMGSDGQQDLAGRALQVLRAAFEHVDLMLRPPEDVGQRAAELRAEEMALAVNDPGGPSAAARDAAAGRKAPVVRKRRRSGGFIVGREQKRERPPRLARGCPRPCVSQVLPHFQPAFSNWRRMKSASRSGGWSEPWRTVRPLASSRYWTTHSMPSLSIRSLRATPNSG